MFENTSWLVKTFFFFLWQFASVCNSVALAAQIKRPPLLRVSPPTVEKKSAAAETGESLQGMYVSQPDNYLKGCESAGLVRQKNNRARGSQREREKVNKEGCRRSEERWRKKLHIPELYGEKKRRGLGHGVTRGRDGNPHFTLSE